MNSKILIHVASRAEDAVETSPGRGKRCWHALLHQLQSINLK